MLPTPKIEKAEPRREYDRIDIDAPIWTKSTTDKAEPRRA